MPKKMKWFIAIGILLNVLLAAGFYVNYRLDEIVTSLSRPGLLFLEAQSNGQGTEGQSEVAENQSGGEYWNKSWGNETYGTGSPGSGANITNDNGSSSQDSQVQNDIANTIGQPVAKSDMVKAALVILKRLNGSEIAYIYNVGQKGSMSDDERSQMHKILLNKLSDDDIATLKSIASKYGHELSILDK